MAHSASRTDHAECTFAPAPRRRLVFAWLLLANLALGFAAVAQQVAESPNATYVGVTTTATITQRFEIYDPHSAEELQAVKEMGFTQVILDWSNLHADATAIGLDVVLANWWTHETPAAEIERALDLAKQVERRNLAGISVMDEPGRNSPETPADYYAELYDRLRPRLDRELPGVRLEISHWGPLTSWSEVDYYLATPLYKSADVMRIMPYPDLYDGPLNDVYFMMQRSKSLMAGVDRDLPLLVILQAWTLPPKSELPTIAELRVMAYQAMLGGATTLSFYHYRPEEWSQTPGFHEAFSELMNELTRLSERFADASIESTMTQTGILLAILTLPSNEMVEIRINTNRAAVDGLDALAVEQSTLRFAEGLGTCHENAWRTRRVGNGRRCSRRSRTPFSRRLRVGSSE
ncbi:MAG: hypothetical protein CMJ64_23810 [Planctomycetaceae bacterium]|nr:hypothetical protein [Planctomycetaceae bacterium]